MPETTGDPIEHSPTNVTAFQEAMRQAEQEAGIPPDTELYGQFLTDRPQDTGPEAEPETLAAAAPAEPEAPPEEPAAPRPETSGEAKLYAGQYKTLEALEQGAVEKQRFIDQLLSEKREQEAVFRAELDQLRAQINEPRVDRGSLEELIETNPAQALAYSLQQHPDGSLSVRDQMLFERSLRAWHEFDSYAATNWQTQFTTAQMQQQLARQFAPQIQRANTIADTSELERAYTNVRSRHDDFEQIIGPLTEERLNEIVQTGVPAEILQGLTGDLAAKEKVLETIYRWEKAERAGALATAAQEAVQQATQEARTAKQEATVASASTTTPPQVPMTEDERMRLVMEQFQNGRNMRKHWTGQESRR